MAVDCIPHAAVNPAAHHAAFHRHPKLLHKVVLGHTPRHHVRLRECAPGTAALPLADLSNDNLAELYVPSAPYAGGGGPASDAAAAAPGAPGVAPAEASGADLPVPDLNNIGSLGGGSPGVGSLPSGVGGGSGGGVIGVPGAPGGGTSGGGGGSGGGSTGGGGTTPPGGGGTTPPGGGGTPPGGGGTTPPGGGGATPPGGGGVGGVPEPATWALMLIGVGAVGAFSRRARAVETA